MMAVASPYVVANRRRGSARPPRRGGANRRSFRRRRGTTSGPRPLPPWPPAPADHGHPSFPRRGGGLFPKLSWRTRRRWRPLPS